MPNLVKWNTTIDSKAKNTTLVPVKEAQFLIVTDTGKLTYDFKGTRIWLGDVVELDTEAERAGIVAPVNKFYFVKDTGILWRYNNGTWIEWNPAKGGTTAVTVNLTASGWSSGKQTVTVQGMTATASAEVGISSTATDAQWKAGTNAALRVTAQSANAITVTANGSIPTIDIPLLVIIAG